MRRLSLRLLTFNVLLIFLPVGSFLYLDTFEDQLLERMERAMVQEGRVMAAALADRDPGREAQRILQNLRSRTESRIRVVDVRGVLLADSAVDTRDVSAEDGSSTDSDPTRSYPDSGADRAVESGVGTESTRSSFLYRAVVPPIRRIIALFSAPVPELPSAEYYSGETVLLGPEIVAALEGRYGAATRVSTGGQRSVTLYSAIPVVDSADSSISAAVLVSRSTYRILNDLYRLRLDVIVIFLYSLVVAVALSLLLSMTITRPLRKLADRMEQLLLPGSVLHDDLQRGFPALRRRDEIGEVSRSLRELWARLESRISLIDDFSADTLHEVKNPLAAIRSSAEVVAAEIDDAENFHRDDVAPFLDTILRETGRIDRLLGDLREITHIDAHLEWETIERVDLTATVSEVIEVYAAHAERTRGVVVVSRIEPSAVGTALSVNRDRLFQILGNLLDNAVDFAVRRVTVTLSVAPAGCVEITVDDDGQGIPAREVDLVFQRFYSGRIERGDHNGLGLSVCRAIVEGYGGEVSVSNRKGGGASFFVRFPTERRIVGGPDSTN